MEKSPEAGFSLIELLMVMGILTVLMGLSSYALFSYSRAQVLTGETAQVATDLRDAQVRARSEERPYKIVFDVGGDTYEIWRLRDPALDPALATSWEKLEGKVLDSGVDLLSASPSSTIVFQPRGVATTAAGFISTGTLTLRSRRLGQDREITVTGLTARVEVK